METIPFTERPISRAAARRAYVVLLWLSGFRDGFLARPPALPEFRHLMLAEAARRMRGEHL